MTLYKKMILTGFSFAEGAIIGLIVYAFLKILEIATNFLWEYIPSETGGNAYSFCIPVIGGILIALFQKKYGVYPETIDTVVGKVRKDGKYDVENIQLLLSAAFLPLLFGASLGPEAGLAGVIVVLVTFIGEKLKYLAETIGQFEEAGIAAAFTVIFASPFAGISENLEIKTSEDNTGKNKKNKGIKILLIIASTVGAMLIFSLLSKYFPTEYSIDRYSYEGIINLNDLYWFIPFVTIGVALGFIYEMFEKFNIWLSGLVKNKFYLSIIGGIGLGLVGTFVPMTYFSGEAQLGVMMNEWTQYTGVFLVLIGINKLFMTTFCLSFNIKGGHIFPLLFSGVVVSYGMLNLLNTSLVFTLAVITTALCGYVMKKPITVIGILFLIFPIRMIIPIALSAIIASFISKKLDTFKLKRSS